MGLHLNQWQWLYAYYTNKLQPEIKLQLNF